MKDQTPILYSFRRCPYAIRARMAIAVSGQKCFLREVVLRNKPPEMTRASPKGTVPIIVLPDGNVIEESLEIMSWALQRNDPEGWLIPLDEGRNDIHALIAENDGSFKEDLDRYKYANRYENPRPILHRSNGVRFLEKLNLRLSKTDHLYGDNFTIADAAILPFIRQFVNHDLQWFNQLGLINLQQWLQNMLKSKRFLDVMGKYAPWVEGDEELVFP